MAQQRKHEYKQRKFTAFQNAQRARNWHYSISARTHSDAVGEKVPVDVKIYLPRIYRARGFRDLASGLFSYAFALMIPNELLG